MQTDLFAVVDRGGAQASPFVVVELPCHPRGKGRPRGRIVNPKRGPAFIHFYTDSETVAAEQAIAWKAKGAMKGKTPEIGPIAARIFAMMPIPQSWTHREKNAAVTGTKFHMSTPDWDNIGKLVCDACNGIIYADDQQLVRVLVHKEYAERPGIIAEFYRLP